MKIYINGVRIENTKGSFITTVDICELISIPPDNAVVSDEDYNELPRDQSFFVEDRDIFYVIRKQVG